MPISRITGERARGYVRPAVYVLAGIVMGVVWALGSDTPAWEHALRVLALVGCAAAAMTLLHRRRARLGRPVDHRLHSSLLLGKVLLVAAALVVDELLGRWVSDPSLITATLLAVTIAVGGPALHRRLSHGGSGPTAQAAPADPRVLCAAEVHGGRERE
ncbi:hypothetical protein HET69_18060 [Streptomyces sp. CJ_13]|uniref:hypothetical protein n=1 Tax=Streptomyces TaxID=1883 RepID=UPI000F3A903A|nr:MULTISPECIES: hypothetical protein [unclassified Streptomyces]AYV31841.1 hypothetical protein EES41_34400 [Streptomyces sp. ADI95-16]MBT1185850.1 hypothetical protein [Streptomyces sp. CJ_13]